MKTRISFVSNSSSNSFVVYGSEVDTLKDAKDFLDMGKEVYCVDERGGTSGDCAPFVFKLTNERYELIRKSQWLQDYSKTCEFHIAVADCVVVNGDSMLDKTIELPELTDGALLWYEKDYGSPATDAVDDKDFMDWYEKRK